MMNVGDATRRYTGMAHRLKVFVLSILSLLLCMLFPVHAESGVLIDLRLVPLLIGFLYGGRRNGIGMLAFFVLYRLLSGETAGLVSSLLLYVVLLVPCLWISPRFLSMARSTRYGIALGFVLLAVPLRLLLVTSLLPDLYKAYPGLLGAVLPAFQLFTMFVAVYLVEMALDKRRHLRDRLLAQRNRVVGQMAAAVAHEIRNPLTVVKGFLSMLERQPDLPESKRLEYVALMQTEVDRADQIIRDYLSLARPESGPLEPLPLAEEVNAVLTDLEVYAAVHRANVSFHNELGNLTVTANREKIHQLLGNLLQNAIDSMPEGGKVHVSAFRDKQMAVVTIHDEGVGMTDEELERLGTAFYSTKEKGTGLGLMVSYHIVDSMKGKLNVQSEKNKGTTFTIALPLKETA